jgi:competence protein ComEA
MDMREQIRVYFSFSKKERTGMIILLIITMLTWIIPYFFSEDEIPEAALQFTPVELEEKIVLLKERATYTRYRDTFPQFRYAEKIRQENYQPKVVSLDINQADSLAWEKLPGIGERLSSRIVRYRERLGGFISMDQLKEVYGINDTLFQAIRPHLIFKKEIPVQKIIINTADYGTLRKHPYCTHAMAKIILSYRKTHEEILTREKMVDMVGIDPKEMERILPYLTFD